MINTDSAPAACKLTGATDDSPTKSLFIDNTTTCNLLAGCPVMLTVDQASGVLQISCTNARQMCREGVLPAVKIGQQWRIPRAWLAEFILNGGTQDAPTQ